MKATLGALVILILVAIGICVWCRPSFSSATPSSLLRDHAIAESSPTPTPQPKTAQEIALEALRTEGLEPTVESFVQTAEQGNTRKVGLFLAVGVKVDEPDAAGRTALAAAASAGQRPVVKLLLYTGADGEPRDASGTNPLMLAARSGSVSTVEEFLSRGTKIDAADDAGRTALMDAITAGQVAAGSALLDHHADLSLRDLAGNDAISLAFESLGDTAFTRTLLEAGAPRTAWTEASREILFRLIRLGDAEGVRLYLQKHAVPPTLAQGRQTLLAYALAWGDAGQLRLLLDCGANPNTPLSIPAEKEYLQCFKGNLLPHYLTEEKGMTLLMVAAGMGRSDLVQVLMEHGARSGALTSKFKIAALIFAAWEKDVPSQLLLLGRKPEIEEQPMRVRISLSEQRAYLYKGGDVALTTTISSGKHGFGTPTGQFVVTDKQVSRMSSLYKVPMPYFMRLSCSEVGMHAGVVPGYPASHGCIRMPRENAQRLYQVLDIGTPVTITN